MGQNRKDVILMETAYFAGGCFWCITPTFREMEGVDDVVSGYSGGEASMAAREFVGWYMDQKTLRTTNPIFPAGNLLAP